MDEHSVTIADQTARASALRQLRDHTAEHGGRIDAQYKQQLAGLDAALQRELAELEQLFQTRHEALHGEYTAALAAAREAYEQIEKEITDTELADLTAASDDLTQKSKETRNARTTARWERTRRWEKKQKKLKIERQRSAARFVELQERWEGVGEAVTAYLLKRGCPELAQQLGDRQEAEVEPTTPETTTPETTTRGSEAAGGTARDGTARDGTARDSGTTENRALREFETLTVAADEELARLRGGRAALFVDRGWVVLLFLAVGLSVFAGLSAVLETSLGVRIVGGLVAGFLVAAAGWWWGTLRARLVTRRRAPEMIERHGQAGSALRAARVFDEAYRQQRYRDNKARYESDMQHIDQQCQETLASLQRRYKMTSQQVEALTDRRRRENQASWETRTEAIRAKFLPAMERHQQQYQQRREQLGRDAEVKRVALGARRDEDWRVLTSRWNRACTAFREQARALQASCEQQFPDAAQVDWDQWKPAAEPPEIVPLGLTQVAIPAMPETLSRLEELVEPPVAGAVPAVVCLRRRPSVLLKATDHGRDAALAGLRALMLRLLTAMPPAKIHFTVIDPTGLGQNFSAFMHLADFDEKLISNRIWTESSHINQRLADLTKHMEDVIQKYLRNEYQSIQEYNAHAGEVAEPFHVLVVANFPTNFSDEAARRLVSIMKSGPRCGVYTLLTVDTKMKMPRNFDLADLESEANTLQWQDGHFYASADPHHQWPIELAEAADEEVTTRAIRAIGKQAQKAQRVEVPFRTVVPDPEEVWQHDSRHELAVPLGRAGATRLQWMRLGKGTSQHVLISGKTGSGKSTLLHAMITNLALYYSPDEVQFYLIDFKKGVEFKPYATHQFPHARVIAIESEREFGMSVLQRLDQELRRRGDLFRDAGVQTVAAYRAAQVMDPMPRLLLMIDEFQEFFVKDDTISQNAALILDRLVRQGRAFGIHVLLGSQTLAGAYSLARSTLGQMAVRIALQCSAADAHLILSEDNEAARLLRRPGEAIYNDANGMFEGNHPFQVVWLSDEEKSEHLDRVRELAQTRQLVTEPAVVFEGNAAADIAANGLLRRALQSPPTSDTPLAPRAWLGESIAIKEPPAVVFHRRAGSNVLMVGQQEDIANNLLGACLFSLAAFSPRPTETVGAGPEDARPQTTRFVVLRPSADSEHAAAWVRWGSRLGCDFHVASGRDVAQALGELTAELQRRQDDEDDTAPPVFLIVADGGQLRELQRSDDDFGFSSFGDDQPASPAKQLNELLRSGPLVGIHTLLWCANYNHVTRCLDRQAIGEFDVRLLLQMSATDSANLMGNADAGRLGAHRALLYHEQSGECEKFRPYGRLADAWCDWASETLAQRVRGLP